IDKRHELMMHNSMVPKTPKDFNEFSMVKKNYLTSSSTLTPEDLCIEKCPPPNDLDKQLTELFIRQEDERYRMRLRHQVERDKLILSHEQDILRLYGNATRSSINQDIPFSYCALLKDSEVYNFPSSLQTDKERLTDSDGKPLNNETAKRKHRWNGRFFIKTIDDSNFKYKRFSMIQKTKDLVSNTIIRYNATEDGSANSYVLAFVLLRAGCEPAAYDFEDFMAMDREERDDLIKEKWSGERVLMKQTREEEEEEKNHERFEAFQALIGCLLIKDVTAENNQTNLKKIIQLYCDELHSPILSYRYSVLLALISILKGLLTATVHSSSSKPGKICPYLGQKDSAKITKYVSDIVTNSIRKRLHDSQVNIRDVAYSGLLTLCQLSPKVISSDTIRECIYDIDVQNDRFLDAIRIIRTLCGHKDLENDKIYSHIKQILAVITSKTYSPKTIANNNAIYMLINDIWKSFSDLFTFDIIAYFGCDIFHSNTTKQKNALNFLIKVLQDKEKQQRLDFDILFWEYMIVLHKKVFKNLLSDDSCKNMMRGIETNLKISSFLTRINCIEYYIEVQIGDEFDTSTILSVFQILRALYFVHLRHHQTHVESTLNQIVDSNFNDNVLTASSGAFVPMEIKNSQNSICKEIASLIFRFSTKIIQQKVETDNQILNELMKSIQICLESLPLDINENSMNIDELLDEVYTRLTLSSGEKRTEMDTSQNEIDDKTELEEGDENQE
ncbi:unnamed protein product, partial [Didymodactylos carnosus]